MRRPITYPGNLSDIINKAALINGSRFSLEFNTVPHFNVDTKCIFLILYAYIIKFVRTVLDT